MTDEEIKKKLLEARSKKTIRNRRILVMLYLLNPHCRHCDKLTRIFPPREKSDSATLDHITPICNGGNHKRENLTLLCRKCNNKKGDKTIGYEHILREFEFLSEEKIDILVHTANKVMLGEIHNFYDCEVVVDEELLAGL